MAKDKAFHIHFTKRSLSDAEAIKEYLLYKFTQREVANFYHLLEIFESVVVAFPELYPKSSINAKIHRAVLSKQLSVFYTIAKYKISVVAILGNRMSVSKWP